jgi:hypothetical protein
MNVKLLTRNGHEQYLQEVTILEIDNKPLEAYLQPDALNHEHRIRILEQILSDVLDRMPVVGQIYNPNSQEEPDPANLDQPVGLTS